MSFTVKLMPLYGGDKIASNEINANQINLSVYSTT